MQQEVSNVLQLPCSFVMQQVCYASKMACTAFDVWLTHEHKTQPHAVVAPSSRTCHVPDFVTHNVPKGVHIIKLLVM